MSKKALNELNNESEDILTVNKAGVGMKDNRLIDIHRVKTAFKKDMNVSPSLLCDGEVRFLSGRSAVLRDGHEEDSLIVTSPEGQIELSVRFTPNGPVLNFDAASIQLKSEGTIAVQCNAFQLDATENIHMSANGDMIQDISGKSSVKAHSVKICSKRGNVDVKANDDVCLTGERIKLNS